MSNTPLLHRIDRIIRESPHAAHRRVFLENLHGNITLRGKVDSFYQKQMIQESIRGIDGVDTIFNLLEVEAPKSRKTPACG